MGQLSGQVILVSGGARAVGAEIALLLAWEGATVVVGDTDAQAAEIGTIGLPGRSHTSLVLDPFSPASWAWAFSETAALHGGLDVVVNCAGAEPAMCGRRVPGGREPADVAAVVTGIERGQQQALAWNGWSRHGGRLINVVVSDEIDTHLPEAIRARPAVKELTRTAALQSVAAGSGLKVNALTMWPQATSSYAIETLSWDRSNPADETRDPSAVAVLERPLHPDRSEERLRRRLVELSSADGTVANGQIFELD